MVKFMSLMVGAVFVVMGLVTFFEPISTAIGLTIGIPLIIDGLTGARPSLPRGTFK